MLGYKKFFFFSVHLAHKLSIICKSEVIEYLEHQISYCSIERIAQVWSDHMIVKFSSKNDWYNFVLEDIFLISLQRSNHNFRSFMVVSFPDESVNITESTERSQLRS